MDSSIKPEFPEVRRGYHLLEYLFEVGPGVAGLPVSYGEIKAWSELTRSPLSGADAAALRSLSVAYMSEYNQASDPTRPAPYKTTIDRVAVDSAFRQMAKRFK